MVFQQFNLFPNMTVLQNIVEAPVHVLGQSREQAAENALSLLEKVGLRARADATVKAVKAQLAAKCGVAAGDLALSWGGKPLWRDGCTIGDYGLRAGATLVATGRVRGGMPTASELRDAFAKFDQFLQSKSMEQQ